MSFNEFFALLRQQWRLLAISIILGALTSVIYFIVTPSQFTAHTIVYVSSASDQSTSGAYDANLLSQQRVKSYVELATSDRISSTVVSHFALSESVKDFKNRLNATSTADSTVMDISVTSPSATESASQANFTTDELIKLVGEIERPTTPGPPTVAVRVVQQASPPESPSSFGVLSLLGIGTILGAVVGSALVVAQSKLSTSIRSAQDAAELSGRPHLASISYLKRAAENGSLSKSSNSRLIAEEFRQLRSKLQFFNIDSTRKALMFTSATQSEGKSTTLSHLALAFGANGYRVIVVDGDLRRPRLSELFDGNSPLGLSTVLTGQLDLDSAVEKTNFRQVDLLSSGPVPPNPSELVGSANMKRVLSTLSNRYDIVLVDAPPVLPVADALGIASLVDGVVLAVRYRASKKAELQECASTLRAVGAPVLGFVLTQTPIPRSTAYSPYITSSGSEPSDESLDLTSETALDVKPMRRLPYSHDHRSPPSPVPRRPR